MNLAFAILEARRNRVPWKVLERVYQRNRRQLWRYCQTARGSAVSLHHGA